MTINIGPARFDAVRSVAFGAITASFTPLGSLYTHVGRVIDIANETDQGIDISFDGTTANVSLAANGYRVYDLQANFILFSKQTQIYVRHRGAAPTSGQVNITLIHARGE